MKTNYLLVPALLVGVGLAALIGSLAVADQPKEAQPAAEQPKFELPPGWTMEDFQAMMAASTPGKMQERLAKEAGVWHGKTTMWMHPGAEPLTSDSTSTVTPIMDGRYTKCEMEGEMPGMGPYHGLAIYGFDNVSQQFVCTWIDNMSTGFANGTGELSEDGKTLTWNFTANCPLTKKPIVLREIETITGPNTKTLEMFGTDPKSGKEFKMMSIELAKK